MIRGDHDLPNADGELEALRGETSWRHLGRRNDNRSASTPVRLGQVRTARRMKLCALRGS